jgi:hypothetical protein
MMTRRPPKPAAVRSARQGYTASNLESATIIASDPALYPEGGLMAEWADVVLSRAVNAEEANAMPLFAAA